MRNREDRRPTLPRLGVGRRFAAAVLAGVVTLLAVGGQIGLVAMYSGEAEQAMAALRPALPASQAVAAIRRSARGL